MYGMPSSASATVFVYNSTVGCVSGHPSRGTAELFEHRLATIFASGRMRTTSNPAEADVFFHPACLVTAFFIARSEIAGPGSEIAAKKALRAIEAAVLLDIEDIGHAHKPHVINALRCRQEAPHPLRPHGETVSFIEFAFPTLWGGVDPRRRPFATFCPEAPGTPQLAAIHTPYCQPPFPKPPLRMNRSISVLFIGSEGRVSWRHDLVHNRWDPTPQRRSWLEALNITPGGRSVVLASRDGREFHGSEMLARRGRGRRFPADAAYHRALMAEANYTMCPPGDAPDTQRIYTAISMGSIPLIDKSFQPPPLVEWSEISAPLRIGRDVRVGKEYGSLDLPSSEATADLLGHVHALAAAFECEPTNEKMLAYLTSELARIAKAPRGVDPPAVQRAAANVDRRYEGCRTALHLWSSCGKGSGCQTATSSNGLLLHSLECFAPPRNRSDCGCLR